MNKFIRLSFCFVSVLVIILSTVPIASAADSYFPIPSGRPNVDEYSGYAELLFEYKPDGWEAVVVVSWTFVPFSNTDVYSDIPQYRIFRNDQFFRIGCQSNTGVQGYWAVTSTDSLGQTAFNLFGIPDDNDETFYRVDYGSEWALKGIHYYGNYTDVTESGPDNTFYVNYADNAVISTQLNNIMGYLQALIDLTDSDSYQAQLDTIIETLGSFKGSFDEFNEFYSTCMDELIRLCNSFFDYLNDIKYNTDQILSEASYMSYLLDTMSQTLWEIYLFNTMMYDELYGIRQDINQILQILQSNSDVTFPEHDTSNLNGYYDSENSLLDDSNVDVSGSINVDINPNAMSAIWDLIDRFLNVNPKVIGAVITILSLGLIALILGR